MNQIKLILSATDLSAPARHAATRAARLAKLSGARLALAHVVSQGVLTDLKEFLGAEAQPVEERLLDQTRRELEQLATEAGQPWDISPTVHLATGAVLKEIAGYADAIDADLLVVGARGEAFMRHLLLGTTSERLLRRTLRPILVVKQTPIDDYRRVLVPVDFSPWSKTSVALARVIAPRADLILTHVFDVPFEGKLRFAGVEEDRINQYRIAARQAVLARLRQLLADAGLDASDMRVSALQGHPAVRIVEQEQEQDCDLIVLGKHGKNAFEELLLGSVTKHVLAESTCDVLVSARSIH